MTPAQKLIPTKELILLAQQQGIKFGHSNPNNRLRYYTKIGLIPHAIRKQTDSSKSFTEGHYPLYVIGLLKKIQLLKKSGFEIEEIKKRILAELLKYEVEKTASNLGKEISLRIPPSAFKFSISRLAGRQVNLQFSIPKRLAYALLVFILLSSSLTTFVFSSPGKKMLGQFKDWAGKQLAVLIKPKLELSPSVAGVRIPEELSFSPQILSENLLLNPSFENPIHSVETDPHNKQKFGQAWRWGYIEMGHKGNFYVSNESVRTGTLAMKVWDSGMEALDTSDGGSPPIGGHDSSEVKKMSPGITQPETTTINGRNYNLSVFIRTKDIKGNPRLKLGFIGSASSNDPNYQGSGWAEYSQDKWQEFPLKSTSEVCRRRNLTSEVTCETDWQEFSFAYENAVLGKYPAIEIVNYQGGRIYLDDASLVEVAESHLGGAEVVASSPSEVSAGSAGARGKAIIAAGLSGANLSIGGGSIKLDYAAGLYPADDAIGFLGLAGKRFAGIYTNETDIKNTLQVGGNTTLAANLKISGAATISGNLKLEGDKFELANRFASDLVPYDDDQQNLGTTSREWRNLYLDGTAYIDTLEVHDASTFTGATTFNLPDNTANALDIQQGTNNYINIDTTDSNETLTLGSTTINPRLNLRSGVLDIDTTGNLTVDTSGTATMAFTTANGNISFSTGTGDLNINSGQLVVDGNGNITLNSSSGVIDIDDATIDLSTQATDFELKDNQSGSLTISQSNNDYLNISTTDTTTSVTMDLPVAGSTSTTANLFTSNVAKTINLGTGTAADTINIGIGGTNADDINLGGLATTTIDILGVTRLGDGGTTNYAQFSATGDLTFVGSADTITGPSGGALTIQAGSSQPLTLTANAASTWQTSAGALIINATSGNLILKTTTSGNLVLDSAGDTVDIDDATLDLSSQATNINLIDSTTNALTFETSLLTLDTQNIRVGIGTTAPSGKLAVVGGDTILGTGTFNNPSASEDLYITGNLEVDGNVWLGDSIANTLTVSSYITSDLIPNPGSQYNLGSNTRRWLNVWADTVTASNISGTIVTGSTSSYDWSIGVGYTGPDAQDMTLTYERGAPAVNTEIRWDSTNKYLSTNSPGFAILPDSNITASGKAALIVNQIQNQDIFTASSSGVPKFVINNAGNVGIGTTAPSGKLHVVGECVAWDSLIPVKSSKCKVQSCSSKLKVKNTSDGDAGGLSGSGEDSPGVAGGEVEYVQIKDIQPGDYVLSLNENTGQFEWQKVEKTLDKGEQEVYELITESGKRIETTGNHPYLIKSNSFNQKGINQNGQQKGDNHHPKGNESLSVNIENINFVSHASFLKINAKPKETIAPNTSPVKINNLLTPFSSEKLGTINTAPNQPADKLTNKSERTENKTGSGFIKTKLSENNLSVNGIWLAVSEAEWTKVIYLKEGQEIAVADTAEVKTPRGWPNGLPRGGGIKEGSSEVKLPKDSSEVNWEKIISIRKTGIRHVYDLQIENTANFVANAPPRTDAEGVWFGGIIAHNTYINSSSTTTPALDIDSTAAVISGNAAGLDINVSNASTSIPGLALTYAGSGFALRVNDDGTYTDSSPFVIDSSGQVGIGTTGPGAKLEVNDGTNNIKFSGNTLTFSRADINFFTSSDASGSFLFQTGGSNPRFRIAADGSVGIGGAGYTSSMASNPNGLVISGNVGIGTISPAAKLHLSQTAASDAFRVDDESGDLSPFVIDQSGNVGIGTTTPGVKLEVLGETRATKFAFQDDSDTYIDTIAADKLSLGTGGQHRLTIDSSGYVGIGTTSPSNRLDVLDATAAQMRLSYSDSVYSTFKTDSSGNLLIDSFTGGIYKFGRSNASDTNIAYFYNSDYSQNLSFGFDGSPRMDSSGVDFNINYNADNNVILFSNATTGENPTLTIYGYDTGASAKKFGTINVDSAGALNALAQSGEELKLGAAGTVHMTFNTSGNVGIGTVSPAAILHLSQTAAADAFRVDDESGDLSPFVIDQSGNVGIGTTTPGALLQISSTALTTGKALDITAIGNAYTTGNLFTADLTQAAASGTSVSGDIAKISFNPTYSTAITTPTISGNVLNISRTSVTNTDFASTLTLSGALASFSDSATQTQGTLTSTADVVRISQNYSSNTGAALNITTAGGANSYALRVNDNGTFTDSTPFVIDSNGNVGVGTTSPSALFSVGASSQFQIDSSGNLTIDGTSVSASSATVTASTFSGSGASLTSIPETAITDGSLLARVGSTETIAGAWTFSAEPVLSGSGRHSRRITLNPEYPGAVLTKYYAADSQDTSVTGTMTSDASPSASLVRTHYGWNSDQATLQYYTVAVRVTLPQDFDVWATSNAIQIDYNTLALANTDNVLDVRIHNADDTPGTAVTSSTGNVVGTLDGWGTITIDDSAIDEGVAPDWDAAGETAVIYLRLGARLIGGSGTAQGHVLVGDIKLNYLSKW